MHICSTTANIHEMKAGKSTCIITKYQLRLNLPDVLARLVGERQQATFNESMYCRCGTACSFLLYIGNLAETNANKAEVMCR